MKVLEIPVSRCQGRSYPPTVAIPTKPSILLTLPGIADDLRRVDAELQRVVESDDPFLTQVARHLIDAGGKRVRPALTITASLSKEKNPGPASKDVVLGGVAVELVHQGSLYHDDVIDGADTRRTVQSVNAKFGNLEAILAGDYLLARASQIAADLGTEIAALLASTIAELCEGQIREIGSAFDTHRTEDQYFQSIKGKTAVLLATAARVGGIVANLPREDVNALTQFGHFYGIAFQVVDDILDIVAKTDDLGKPTGNDLCEGVYTLPVIRTLKGSAGAQLRSLISQPIADSKRNKALAIIRKDQALSDSIATAIDFANQANKILDDLPPTPATKTMRQTCEVLLARIKSASMD